jgi:GT2 family glycosyltransferase
VSVALAVVTRDRPDLLARHLIPSLRGVGEDVDIVIVDQSNGGETRRLVERLGRVRYLRSGPGLSTGRNVAIRETAAEILVFTDDDVAFGPDWLPRMRDAFDAPDIGAVCGGGTEGGLPLPVRDNGVQRWPANPFHLGFGYNLAFRSAALRDAGPFDELLGGGARFGSAEDTDMLYRVLRAGWAVRCDGTIAIRHAAWRDPAADAQRFRVYGLGFSVQTVKHVREGDLMAAAIAASELGRHAFWTAYSLARRDRVGLRRQRAWLGGVLAGPREARRAWAEQE